ncbi:MAG: endonuclease III [Clostridia bacterium]|nr:endonuclease III [Clostridia bacterium]
MQVEDKELKEILDILDETYPDALCALNHNNVFELLVAVTLSAQTKDDYVNMVTPELFRKYGTPDKLANADIKEVEKLIKRIGMYHNKAKNIIGLSKALVDKYDSKVPSTYDELVTLPGVGRKTANVVLAVGFGVPRIAVDTHVFRVSNRIGITDEKDVLKTELKLMERIPKERWIRTHHTLIFHGRNICDAKKPKCDICPLGDLCQKKWS